MLFATTRKSALDRAYERTHQTIDGLRAHVEPIENTYADVHGREPRAGDEAVLALWLDRHDDGDPVFAGRVFANGYEAAAHAVAHAKKGDCAHTAVVDVWTYDGSDWSLHMRASAELFVKAQRVLDGALLSEQGGRQS